MNKSQGKEATKAIQLVLIPHLSARWIEGLSWGEVLTQLEALPILRQTDGKIPQDAFGIPLTLP